MTVKWEDVSSYSRDEKERIPRSFELRAGMMRFVVTRHNDFPRTWVLRCPFWDLLDLRTDDESSAKLKALATIKRAIRDIADDLAKVNEPKKRAE